MIYYIGLHILIYFLALIGTLRQKEKYQMLYFIFNTLLLAYSITILILELNK